MGVSELLNYRIFTQECEFCDAGIKVRLTRCLQETQESEAPGNPLQPCIVSELDKKGKGRLPNVGDLRGMRIPEIGQKSAKTAVFSVSVAATVSRLLPLHFRPRRE
jgi:hypothetical protein